MEEETTNYASNKTDLSALVDGNEDDVQTDEKGGAMVVILASVGGVAAALVALGAVYAARRFRKAKSTTVVGLADKLEEGMLPSWNDTQDPVERESVEGVTSEKTALISGEVSSGRTSDIGPEAVLHAHAVRVLTEAPDKLGIIKLHGCIGSGVSSRVRPLNRRPMPCPAPSKTF